MSMITVKGLYKTFLAKENQVEALKDINLDIEEGDIYGIIGMSGAGKSTLVRCLNFLERPTAGEVWIDGRNLADLSEPELRAERKNIGMIFQSFNLLMQKNVLANVCFPLIISGVPRKEAARRAEELLSTVGLADKARAYPAQLSGGQQQRVAIARALATNPRILLCDEATSALDPQTTQSILDLLRDINLSLGITIVIITHQMSVVTDICNKVAIIENGVMVEKGSVEEVFTHPQSRAAKELISRDLVAKLPDADELPGRSIRIVFPEITSGEPIIADMILKFGIRANILKANIREVGGVGRGEMILKLEDNDNEREDIIMYLKSRGLIVEEV